MHGRDLIAIIIMMIQSAIIIIFCTLHRHCHETHSYHYCTHDSQPPLATCSEWKSRILISFKNKVAKTSTLARQMKLLHAKWDDRKPNDIIIVSYRVAVCNIWKWGLGCSLILQWGVNSLKINPPPPPAWSYSCRSRSHSQASLSPSAHP